MIKLTDKINRQQPREATGAVRLVSEAESSAVPVPDQPQTIQNQLVIGHVNG